MMKWLRGLVRLLLFLLSSFVVALLALLFRLVGFKHSFIYRVFFLGWIKVQKIILNIKVTLEGELPSEPCIIMANHRSYVDVLFMPKNLPATFVAKAEVRKWPIIGWGGDAMRTVWVDRKDQDSRRKTRAQLKERLSQNKSVIIFPEGTTYKGPEVGELKPGMFQTCAEGKFPIFPVAVEYKNANIAWTGDAKFLPHFIQKFGARKLEVSVKYGSLMCGDNGEALRQKTHDWLTHQTLEYRRFWDQEIWKEGK